MSFAGRRVVITGGGTGIGADMARGFAAGGAEVWIAGRKAAALAAVAGACPGVRTALVDVTVEASVTALFAATGAPDIVIANAGIAESARLDRTDLDLWSRTIATNLTGVFLTFREALRAMQGKPWGRLVAVASVASLRGGAYISAYAASKHGVLGLVRSAALETAKGGITVNAICPGYVDTEMTERTVANMTAKTGMSAEEARARLAALNPTGRLVTPAEVTQAALWLCGPGSGSVNGQGVALTGGEP